MLKKILSLFVTTAVFVMVVSFANAQPPITLLTCVITKLKFVNYERLTHGTNPGNDLNAIDVGDFIEGILKVESITNIPGDIDLSTQLLTTELTGHFKLSVIGGGPIPVNLSGTGHLDFALLSGDFINLYADTTPDWNPNNSDGMAIARATDGILWASTQPGTFFEGINETVQNPVQFSITQDWANLTINNTGYQISPLLYPESIPAAPVHTYMGVPHLGGHFVDAYFTSHLTSNLPIPPGQVGWDYRSEDPVYMFATGSCIDIVKETSVDNGTTWLDADTVDTAAKATAPHGALYRLIVTNCGNVDLANVIINDPTLGIINYPVGNLAAGASVTLTSGEIPQLDVPVRCDQAGEFENISSVSGEDASGNIVTDSDPAWLVCTPPPCIDLEKQISIDGGTTWLDADTVDAAAIAEAPHDAMYRLIVTNCGSVDLANVAVTDPTLGINYSIGNLAVGASVTLTSGDIPQLDVPVRCSTAGAFDNIACVSGTANGVTENDCDPAWLVCEERQFGACRMTHGSVTVNQDGTFAIEGPYAEATQPKPRTTKKNAKGSSSNNTTPTPKYTWGGQIGAPQANDPSYGEMTHTQHDHPVYGSFTFHAGTASASPGTEITSVQCTDRGWCENARCAPFKQIYWNGIGEFENMSLNNPFPGCTVRQKSHRQGGTLHYLEAHASDFGEPGGNFPPGDGPQPSEALCSWVSGGTDINNVNLIGDTSGVPPPPPGSLHGDKGSQACDECPDYYEINIHCTTDPNSPIIYQVHDFIDRGNIQIHPEVGDQCPY